MPRLSSPFLPRQPCLQAPNSSREAELSVNFNPSWERNTSNYGCLEVLDHLSSCPVVSEGGRVSGAPQISPPSGTLLFRCSGVLPFPQKAHGSHINLIDLAQGSLHPISGTLPKTEAGITVCLQGSSIFYHSTSDTKTALCIFLCFCQTAAYNLPLTGWCTQGLSPQWHKSMLHFTGTNT